MKFHIFTTVFACILWCRISNSYFPTDEKVFLNEDSRNLWKANVIENLCREMKIKSIALLFYKNQDSSFEIILRRIQEHGVPVTSIFYNAQTKKEFSKRIRKTIQRGERYFVMLQDNLRLLTEMLKQIDDDLRANAYYILFPSNWKEGSISSFGLQCSIFPWLIGVEFERSEDSSPYVIYSLILVDHIKSKTSFSCIVRCLKKYFTFNHAFHDLKFPDLRDKTFTLAANELEPFVKLKIAENLREELYSGIDAKVILTLQEKFNFKILVLRSNDGEWGRYANKTWTGLIGMLQREEADLGIGCLTQTNDRKTVVEFSTSYHMEEFSLVTRIPDPRSKVFAVVMPFQKFVWIGIMVSICMAIGILYVCENLGRNLSLEHAPGLGKISWFLYGTIVNESCNVNCFKQRKTFYFIAIWLCSVLIFRASYPALLMSFMSIPGCESSINTLNDVAKRMEKSSNYVCGAVKGTYNHEMLLNLSGNLKTIADRVKKNENTLVKTIRDGLYLVSLGDHCMILPVSSALFEARAGGMRNIYITEEVVKTGLTSVAMRKNFPYRKAFNVIIQRLSAMGIIEKWRRDEIEFAEIKPPIHPDNKNEHCEHQYLKDPSSFIPLVLSDLQGAFLLLLYALFFEILTFMNVNVVKTLPKQLET